jgi:hypothetical protein
VNSTLPGFITHDNAASTNRKTRYILKQRGFGGVFMWELSADYDGHAGSAERVVQGLADGAVGEAGRCRVLLGFAAMRRYTRKQILRFARDDNSKLMTIQN